MSRADQWLGAALVVVGCVAGAVAGSAVGAAELKLRVTNNTDPLVTVDVNDVRALTNGSVFPFRIGYGWGMSGLEYDADEHTCHAFGDMEMAARVLYDEVRKANEREAAAWARTWKAEAALRQRDTDCGPHPRMPIELMTPGAFYLSVRP